MHFFCLKQGNVFKNPNPKVWALRPSRFICKWQVLKRKEKFWYYIKIQSKTLNRSTRLRGITSEFVGCIPQSLEPSSIFRQDFNILKLFRINGLNIGNFTNFPHLPFLAYTFSCFTVDKVHDRGISLVYCFAGIQQYFNTSSWKPLIY